MKEAARLERKGKTCEKYEKEMGVGDKEEFLVPAACLSFHR